jgi:hypothetical protein
MFVLWVRSVGNKDYDEWKSRRSSGEVRGIMYEYPAQRERRNKIKHNDENGKVWTAWRHGASAWEYCDEMQRKTRNGVSKWEQ